MLRGRLKPRRYYGHLMFSASKTYRKMLYDKWKTTLWGFFFLFKINHLLSNEFCQSFQEKKKIFDYIYALYHIFLCQFLLAIQRIKK